MRFQWKWFNSWLAAFALAAVGVLVVACGGSNAASSPVKHVFVITLENEGYSTTFGTSTQNPYMQHTLVPMGAMLSNYYGTTHVSLGNYIAMISGQPNTLAAASDCQVYQDFTQTGTSADGFPIGTGCVFPASVKTLPDQLKAAGYTWKGYMEDMGNNPTRESATCGHPTLNALDATQSAQAPSAANGNLGDQYASRHNPFVYFHSIIDSPDCAANVVPLTALQADLATSSTTANFTFITPNLCNDGHDGNGTGAVGHTCVNGNVGGLAQADQFLQKWIPLIMASPAYQNDGLIIINFDEGAVGDKGTTVASANGVTTYTISTTGASCCNQQPGPNVSYPLDAILPVSASLQYDLHYLGMGGDQTGAILISKFIKPGTVTSVGYNHYALLKSIEDIFGLGHLGYANQSGLVGFGSDIFNNVN